MSLCLTSAQKPTRASSKSDISRGVFGIIEKTPHRIRRTIPVGLRLSRPFGTCALRALNPGLDTPGYSHLSLRDSGLACSITTMEGDLDSNDYTGQVGPVITPRASAFRHNNRGNLLLSDLHIERIDRKG